MSQDLILSLIAFAFVTAMTPGPNNTVLLTSGVNFGFNRTRPHVLGVTIGFTIMILAVGLATAGTSNPVVTDEARPMTFFEAALFQWVNPKGWMVALRVAANYVSLENLWADLMALSAIFLVVSLISTTSWAFFGTSLRPLLQDPKSVRIFNVAMAVALVASLWSIVREMI